MLARIVLAAALGLAAAPAWTISVGCATPSSNTTYYVPTKQSCGGASVLVSDSLMPEWSAGTSSAHGCDALSAGMLRYQDALMQFCDGTAWQNLYSTGSSGIGLGDRITSGTTSLVVVSATGYVSLTQAGTNTGWFDPARGLVTLGTRASRRHVQQFRFERTQEVRSSDFKRPLRRGPSQGNIAQFEAGHRQAVPRDRFLGRS